MELAEYDRLVIGYHGTRRETALKIVTQETTYKASHNDDDWLVHGIYFWEHAPQQAWEWARKRYAKSSKIAVLGAVIRLRQCLDLLDPANGRLLQRLHADMKKAYKESGTPIKENANHKKYLDCLTCEYAYAALEAGGMSVDSSRGVYVPTGSSARLWTRSWLSKDAHIQLCIREPSCILGSWLVEEAS